MSDVTLVLEAVRRGEKQASEELLPMVYEELRRMAAAVYHGTNDAVQIYVSAAESMGQTSLQTWQHDVNQD
jgi:hypothetical protein